MLSTELIKHQIDAFTILNDPLNQRLILSLSKFSDSVKRFGYDLNLYSERSLQKLPEVSDSKKEQLISYFNQWATWINSETETETSEEIERICLKKALDYYGFQMDDEFWKTIEKDHIVELYGRDMVQLYRSLNFFKITGYSLLDICIFEWFVLWDRPRKSLEAAMELAKEVLASYVPAKRYQIQPHVIRETYNAAASDNFVPRAVLAEFMFAGSLTKKGFHEGYPAGIICSSKAEVLTLGDEAYNIQFL